MRECILEEKRERYVIWNYDELHKNNSEHFASELQEQTADLYSSMQSKNRIWFEMLGEMSDEITANKV